MKRRMLLVVLALAVLPALGEGNYGTLRLKTRNVERLVAEIADWTNAHELPTGNHRFQWVLICQNRAWGAPNTVPQSCYSLLYARNLDDGSGYIRDDVMAAAAAGHKANEWYRVNRKRNSWLERRVKDYLAGDTPFPDPGPTPSYPAYRGCWYGEIVYDCSGN